MSSQLAARAAASSLPRSSSWMPQIGGLLFQAGDRVVEGVDVCGCAEPGFLPGLLAERLGQALFELLDTSGEPEGTFVGGEQVRLQGGPGDGRAGAVGGRAGLGRVDLAEQVAVPVKERAVDAARIRAISDRAELSTVTGTSPGDLEDAITCADVIIDATVSIALGQALSAVAATERPHAVLAQLSTDTSTGTLGILTVSASNDPDGPAVIDTRAGRTVMADPALEPYHTFWREPLAGHELIPTRGCSVPTFHGSAADLAAVAACLVNLLAIHLTTPVSGTHLIALPHAPGSGPHHRFIAA